MTDPAPPTELEIRRRTRVGLAYGLACYTAWGLLPIYFTWVLARGISPLVLVSHRIIWALLFLLAIIAFQSQWRELLRVARSKKAMAALVGSTIMIALNWYVFVYAVEARQIQQAALGYFINPLVNVLLGFVFLRERLRRMQLIGLALATIGVGILTWNLGALPWIPFALAGTFGMYGLLRKTMPAGPLIGLTIETMLLLPASVILAGIQFSSDLHLPAGPDGITYGLLSASGVITAVPLLWFAGAARRLRLATMGILQYTGPTIQMLVAVFYRNEPFGRIQWITFSLIWSALILYTFDSLRAMNESRERNQAEEQESRRELASEIE